ncbi:tetratricopeptide repeat protein [Vibrio ponticus]|uniref:tetratricopeptide repeat protein n=1 Tax=Vibrio ponticus TaxID=265668 RepID=UPI0009FA214C|nr:sel1 repeat family protein [Vibrio ponticus]
MIKFPQSKQFLVFWFVVTLALLSSNIVSAQPKTSPQESYDRGILLYQQNKYTEARPFLTIALEHGYPAAGLMLADTYKTNIFAQTKKEAKYLLKAAELGNFIAMFRLGGSRSIHANRQDWDAIVIPEIKRLAKRDYPYAMRLMHALSVDDSESDQWLERAANSGDPFSQHKLAKRYKNGYDWFLIPGKRERELERLLKAASDSGYREGMLAYAKLLKKNGDIQGYQKIIDELVVLGDAETIRTLGAIYEHEGDLINAAYYNQIFLNSMGNESHNDPYKTVENFQNRIVANLTEQELAEIDSKVAEYLATHTVHYQKRIEEYEYTLESLRQQTK